MTDAGRVNWHKISSSATKSRIRSSWSRENKSPEGNAKKQRFIHRICCLVNAFRIGGWQLCWILLVCHTSSLACSDMSWICRHGMWYGMGHALSLLGSDNLSPTSVERFHVNLPILHHLTHYWHQFSLSGKLHDGFPTSTVAMCVWKVTTSSPIFASIAARFRIHAANIDFVYPVRTGGGVPILQKDAWFQSGHPRDIDNAWVSYVDMLCWRAGSFENRNDMKWPKLAKVGRILGLVAPTWSMAI